MFYLTTFILLLYLICQLFLLFNLNYSRNHLSSNLSSSKKEITILIPFRNEAHHLPTLCLSIMELEYHQNYFKVFFIDDHSDDEGKQLITQTLKNSGINFQIIELPKHVYGKKNAINYVQQYIENEYVIHTDADCKLPQKWLEAYNTQFNQENSDLVLAPVQYEKRSTKFSSRFQEIENALMMGLAQATTKLGIPMIANGANMGYNRNKIDFDELYQETSASGDDIFLLHHFKSIKAKIRFIDTPDITVKTPTLKNWNVILLQRLRWASKIKNYKDKSSLIIGGLVSLTNLTTIMLSIKFITNGVHHFLLLLLFLRFVIDFTFTIAVKKYRVNKSYYITSLLVTIFYPIYSLLIGLISFFYHPQWKGRKV